ncbi:carboxymuconolactone decarboxylase family protein [Microbacterium invictum]|uniref:4-carboxymuconolactone decarboxylase n=1 Tax=Microbacterium invictum TaxID=515415 RepID=A0AA40VPL0_9MICO|nr:MULTISPECIES: carboxymuconolactone decarboxylase family protein [Microbacterium]MBB4141423.1 4-carboxymuconolactone decarboxylase [Microbacterium invictum]
MGRISHLVPGELSAEQQHLYTQIAGGPRAQGPQHFALTRPDGSLTGPFNVMLHAPGVGEAVQALGAAIRFGSSLSDRVRELAILVVAVHAGCRYEWDAHAAIGRAIGLTEHELSALAAGTVPRGLAADEREAVEFARAAARGDAAPSASHLDARTQVELCTLVGYYALLAQYLRVFDADEAAVIPAGRGTPVP